MPAITVLKHTGPQSATLHPSPERPVRVVARDLAADTVLASHSHDWGQLTCTMSGVLRVTAAGSSWIVPPDRAIWIAPGVDHAITVLEPASLRPLWIDARHDPFAPGECKVLEISPLLRESIVALLDLDTPAPSQRELLLGRLILDELPRCATTPVHIPLPRDKRLQALCNALLDDPSCSWTLAEWAGKAGASERTLARLFEKELGMGFGQWRQQARLAHAAPLIARGVPLAQVAGRLGYASQSAFTASFKKVFGVTPSAFLR
jgi:AraC-like DNA-binding protein